MKQRKISEAGSTNPSKFSLKVSDVDRHVNYEESPPVGSHSIHESVVLATTGKILHRAETDIRTITGR
jgi:hypothetical protein